MGEFDWIKRYLKPIATSDGARSLSDDVAELKTNPDTVLIASMDTLIEDVHFLRSDPIDSVARKLVRVNVSDILSKGGQPTDAMLSIAWPAGRPEEHFAAFAAALGDDLKHWGCDLVGGDTVSTAGPLVLTLMITGACARTPPLRSGARAGDAVIVSGEIGAGGLGLQDAKIGRASVFADRYRIPALPAPTIGLIISEYANASIDVSDGLLSDLGHIASASGVGISIDLADVPFVVPEPDLGTALDLSTAGDDYQCLFTVRADRVESCLAWARSAGLQLTPIGCVGAGDGIELRFKGKTVAVPARTGFQHG